MASPLAASTECYSDRMKQLALAAAVLAAVTSPADLLASSKQAQSRNAPDLCVVPPGASAALDALGNIVIDLA